MMNDEKVINCGIVMGGQNGSRSSSLRQVSKKEEEMSSQNLNPARAAMLPSYLDFGNVPYSEIYFRDEIMDAFCFLCTPSRNRF